MVGWSGNKPGAERRRHRRVSMGAPVAVLSGAGWQGCEIADVSRGGASFLTALRPEVDKEIVVRIEALGLFKCRVLRHTEQGFAARFEAADFSLPEDAPEAREAVAAGPHRAPEVATS